MESNLHKIWDKQSKDSWLNQLKKDNPNMDLSDYFRLIDDGIYGKSFAFPTDIKAEDHVRKISGTDYFCKVGIKLHYDNLNTIKSALNLALENGAEYIHFVLPEKLSSESFELLMENVYLDMLITRWNFPSIEMMNDCKNWITQRFENATAFYTINKPSLLTDQTMVYSFAPFQTNLWVSVLIKMLNDFKKNSLLFKNVIFEFNLNNDFLLNISSIRALKLVLNKIWKLFELNVEFYLEATIDNNILSSNLHSNIYKLAAGAFSASISGIDFLIVPPADVNTGQSDLQWLKTSLHTQHIIKQESHLMNLVDPAAGSYFIEDLTEQIADKLWSDLQENVRND